MPFTTLSLLVILYHTTHISLPLQDNTTIGEWIGMLSFLHLAVRLLGLHHVQLGGGGHPEYSEPRKI